MENERITNPKFLENLHKIQMLCTFPARGEDPDSGTWVQSVNYIEEEDALYIANQANNGLELRIDKRTVDGTFVESKILSIERGTYVESLSYFYNELEELIFIIFSQRESCSLYNYTTETLSPIQLNFRGLHKNAIYKNYFVTTTMINKSLRSFYFYDLAETKAENMSEPIVIKPDYSLPLWQKSQGFTIVEDHIIVSLGSERGHPGLAIIDKEGNLRESVMYDATAYFEALKYNEDDQDVLQNNYENEGVFLYKGKLCFVQIFNGTVILVLHNEPKGQDVELQTVFVPRTTDWEPITLLNRAIPYASDTVPRIKRTGTVVRVEGALKGLRSVAIDVARINPDWAPDRNIQFTCPASSGATANWQISRAGVIKILTVTKSTITTATWFPFAFEWDIA